LAAAFEAKLCERVVNMGFGRGQADLETTRDLLVGEPLVDQLNDFKFAPGRVSRA
jgi:hypothetical protein